MRTANIKCSYIRNNAYRIEGEFFLNDNSYLSLPVEQHRERCTTLGEIANVFNPGIFKRQFCVDTPHAVQYFQSSDVNSISERSLVFVNKQQAEKLNLLVHKGDILITGFGTIGNTRIVSSFQNETCFANNVCRVRVSEESDRGYIYAFLSSKYGSAQLNKNASGSVVRYIEAPGIRKTLVPIVSDALKFKINDLISSSVILREKSYKSLTKSHELIEGIFPNLPTQANTAIISIKDIWSSQAHRMESLYHIAGGKFYDAFIRDNFAWKPLGDVSKSISRPDIFKRVYVDNGITFLGGTDIMLSIPDSKKKLSKKAPNVADFIVDEGWILLPRSGTIGDVVYTTSQHAQKLVSEHVIRIIPNDILRGGYVFAFLSSKIGRALIKRPIFGSVIQHVEPPLLKTMPIPVIEDEKMEEISNLAETYRTAWGEACKKELEAISLVEAEIEKWNK